VVRELVRAGHRVRVLARPKSKRDGLAGSPCEVALGDVLDAGSIAAAVEGCELVYHLAARMSTRRRASEAMFAVNVAGASNVFSACLAARTPRVVYAASIFALGGPDGPEPLTEDAAYNLGHLPVPYFQSRRAAEEHAWRFVERGLPLVFLYPCFCFGPGDVYISSTRILLDFLRMPIPFYPKGGINAVDVRDVAAAFAAAATRGAPGQRYLLGGVNLSFQDFFRQAARAAGRRRPLLPLPTAPARLAARVMERTLKHPPLDEAGVILLSRTWYYDSSKARRDLGFAPRPLEETLRDAVADLRARGFL
jgi:dihydroflavonol-4-reductase